MSELQRPPRSIPLFLTIQSLFGGLLQQIGWGLFAFGMIFVLLFGAGANLSKALAFQSELGQVQGTVLSWRETNTEVNERTVVAYQFEYSVDGTKYTGESFTSTTGFDEGESVTVEYPLNEPGISRIRGTGVGSTPPWILLLVGIFPAIGLAMGAAGFRSGLEGRNLLVRGLLGHGTLISGEPTAATVNEHPVYALTFEFEASSTGRKHTVVAKNHDTSALEDEEQERILYLPSDPDTAVVFDNLPGKADIDSRGAVVGGSFRGAVGSLILPLVGLAMVGLTIMVMMPD